MTTTGLDKTVSASDVEKYGYCPLSWWLSEQNTDEETAKQKRGIKEHTLIGQDVKNIKTKEKSSEESERGVFWFSIIALIIGINGVAIVYTIYTPSRQGEAIMIVLSIIAVIWVMVAAMFFYMGIKMEKRARTQKAEAADIKDAQSPVHEITQFDPELMKRFSEAKWNTVLFLIISGVLAVNGIMILFSIGQVDSELFSTMFIILSLSWLFGSSFFYYISLRREILSKGSEDNKVKEKRTFTDSEISIVLFAVVATVFATNSFTIFQDPNSNIGWVILALSILWLYGGFIFLYRALRANMNLKLLIGKKKKEVEQLENELGADRIILPDIKIANKDYERKVIWFAAIAMILALNTIVMNFTRNLEEEVYGSLIAHIFEVIALLWLIGASVFLYVVLLHSMTASKLREQHGIKEGKIEYVDELDGHSKILISKKYGLRGRPDYIIEKEGNLIPVEVKTGRVPRGPLFSHILQLAAYCLLMEERYKIKPPYGIIRYNEIQHEIDYTNELENILTSKLEEMREIIRTGEAHRNHKRENKCRGCSRRDICPEKLV
jgi:CRISPR-associated exonuclease Cas4